jgi:hypothetical protein
MKKVVLALTALSMVFAATSCMTTFSPSLRSEFSNNKIAMNEVQFFNSEKIELEREIKSKEAKVSKGTYVKAKESMIETVVFRKNTPGGFLGEDGESIKIAFDEKDDNKYLIFKHTGSKYVLDSVKGKILYNGIEYKVVSGEEAYLSIDADDSQVERENEITVRGRRIIKKRPSSTDIP